MEPGDARLHGYEERPDRAPGDRVSTDSSGSFSREFDKDLAKHPTLLANLLAVGVGLLLITRRRSGSPA
jgi:hypothetical protein